MEKLVIDIPMLKKQYCAVLHAQKMKGTTRRVHTLLEGVLNFFDDIITVAEHGSVRIDSGSVPDAVEKRMAKKTEGELTAELKDRFSTVLNALSPENLTCDGMLPPGEVRKRLRAMNAEWSSLEKRAGRKVSQDEVSG